MKKVFKFGCLGVVGLFVLLVIIGLMIDDTSTTTTTDEKVENQSQETDEKKEEPSIKKVGLGQELIVGNVTFIANSVDELNQITAGNGMFKYTPDAEGAVFLNVNVTVKNNGKDMIQTDSSFFKLKTEDGVEYSPSTVIVADDKYFTYEGINPGLALTGNVVFEVPSGLSGLDLQVQTGFWGTETGIINLN